MPAAMTPLRVRAPWVDPEDAFGTLYAEAGDVFWLDSGADAVSGLSYLGSSERTLVGATVPSEVAGLGLGLGLGRGPEGGSATPALSSGWVGWVSYEAACRMLDPEAVDTSAAGSAAAAT